MNTATGFVLFWMHLWGFYGWTSPFGTVYCLPGCESSQMLARHEYTHVAQLRRDGFLLYNLKSLWYVIRYGYKNSPYEVEARNAEQG